jgi:hypothetical protein
MNHAMKTYWVSRNKAPCILNLDNKWMWRVSFTHNRFIPSLPATRWVVLDPSGWREQSQPLVRIEPRPSSPYSLYWVILTLRYKNLFPLRINFSNSELLQTVVRFVIWGIGRLKSMQISKGTKFQKHVIICFQLNNICKVTFHKYAFSVDILQHPSCM